MGGENLPRKGPDTDGRTDRPGRTRRESGGACAGLRKRGRNLRTKTHERTSPAQLSASHLGWEGLPVGCALSPRAAGCLPDSSSPQPGRRARLDAVSEKPRSPRVAATVCRRVRSLCRVALHPPSGPFPPWHYFSDYLRRGKKTLQTIEETRVGTVGRRTAHVVLHLGEAGGGGGQAEVKLEITAQL